MFAIILFTAASQSHRPINIRAATQTNKHFYIYNRPHHHFEGAFVCESGSNRNHRAGFQASHLAHISFAPNCRLKHTHLHQFSEIVAAGRPVGLKSPLTGQGLAVNFPTPSCWPFIAAPMCSRRSGPLTQHGFPWGALKHHAARVISCVCKNMA
jgi:hypothetical protein